MGFAVTAGPGSPQSGVLRSPARRRAPGGQRVGKLDGKVAFVTGAGRGQGRSHAIRLAEEGADIIAVDICAPIDTVTYGMATEADLSETASLVEALDRRVMTAVADVRDFDRVRSVMEEGRAELGG